MQTYNVRCKDNDEIFLRQVPATRVSKSPDWFPMIAHREVMRDRELGTNWVVTEVSTGFVVTTGSTRQSAINGALNLLKRNGKKKALGVINKILKEYGQANKL